MPGDPLELALLAAADLLPRGASVLAACSGGPDSVALTGALARSAPALAIRLSVGHVDHGLRPESARDGELVRDLARRLGLPFHLVRIEALEVGPLGLEGAARQARYEALARLAAEAGADRVATAHTRRDQAETVLLRLARGSGAGAVAGVRRSRALTGAVLLVRPLLDVPREATEAYCRAAGLPTVEDAHNLDPRRARTRLRELMPRLASALNPRLEEALAGVARIAADEDALLDGQSKAGLADAATGDGFSTGRLATLHPALLRRALLLAAQGVGRPERGHLDRLASVVREGGGGGLDFPGGRAVIERGVLRFEKHGPPPAVPADVRVPGPGVYRWAGGALHVGSGAQRANLLLAPFPWTLRRRLPGDRFRLAGGPERKLGDAFQTAGIPASRRGRIPLLADAAGRVFWVEGLPRGHACAAPPGEAMQFEFAPEMDALR